MFDKNDCAAGSVRRPTGQNWGPSGRIRGPTGQNWDSSGGIRGSIGGITRSIGRLGNPVPMAAAIQPNNLGRARLDFSNNISLICKKKRPKAFFFFERRCTVYFPILFPSSSRTSRAASTMFFSAGIVSSGLRVLRPQSGLIQNSFGSST